MKVTISSLKFNQLTDLGEQPRNQFIKGKEREMWLLFTEENNASEIS